MGWPAGAEYAENSNVTHAAKLRGRLLLILGELDRNVDPASTLQVVRALVGADKDFELLALPGAGHGAGEHPYVFRRRISFFCAPSSGDGAALGLNGLSRNQSEGGELEVRDTVGGASRLAEPGKMPGKGFDKLDFIP